MKLSKSNLKSLKIENFLIQNIIESYLISDQTLYYVIRHHQHQVGRWILRLKIGPLVGFLNSKKIRNQKKLIGKS